MGTGIFITESMIGDIFYIISAIPPLIISFLISRWLSIHIPIFNTDKSYISLKEKYENLEIKYDLLAKRYTKLLKEYNRLKSEQ